MSGTGHGLTPQKKKKEINFFLKSLSQNIYMVQC